MINRFLIENIKELKSYKLKKLKRRVNINIYEIGFIIMANEVKRKMTDNILFNYESVQTFNDTEIAIYKYIISNVEKIPYMTIRELSKSLNVSTSTVLRFCVKNNCNTYKEFKNNLCKYIQETEHIKIGSDLSSLLTYFSGTNTNAFEEKIQRGANILKKSDQIIFLGLGSSGALANYGARFFSNLGNFSISLEDTLYPITSAISSSTTLVVLSVTGETMELINFIEKFQRYGCQVISITNQIRSTIAKISDWNISYNLDLLRVNGGYNATSQVPVLFVIEALAKRI